MFFMPSTRILALIGLPEPPFSNFHDLQSHRRLNLGFHISIAFRDSIIAKPSGQFNGSLKFHFYAILASHMVPGTLVPLHDQYTLN